MSNAGEWAAKLKAFHEKQLDRPRRVYRIGRTKMMVTGGHAASTVGAAFAATSVDSPTWLFWVAVASGYFGGKYIYPIPRSSVASRTGPRELSRKSPGDLDYMTPAEIRAYQYNLQLTHKGSPYPSWGLKKLLAASPRQSGQCPRPWVWLPACWRTFP